MSVHCQGEAASTTRRRRTVLQAIITWWSRFLALYDMTQVSCHGQYSLERLNALDEYCKKTSLARVLCVCICTPFPVLIVVLLSQNLPLRPPCDGWAANYWFWIRFYLLVAVITLSTLVQATTWIPELPLTKSQMVALAALLPVPLAALDVYVASQWVFPVPFMVILDIPVLFVTLTAGMWAVARFEVLRKIPNGRARFQEYIVLLSSQTALLLIYPAFNGAFMTLSREYQPPFIVLLAVFKVAMRNAIAHFGPQLEDHLPESIVFSVEVFNTLYMVVCMQNIYSFWVIGFLMLVDVSFTVVAHRTLSKRYILVRDFQRSQPTKSQDALFDCVFRLVQQPGQLQKQGFRGIRLHAKLAHRASRSSSDMLKSIARAMEFADTAAASQSPAKLSMTPESSVTRSHVLPTQSTRKVSPTSIAVTKLMVPVNQKPRMLFKSVIPIRSTCKVAPAFESSLSAMKQQNTEFVSQTLHLLFHCEYLILAEYVEWMIPLLYVVYFPVLKQLANSVYFPSTRDIDNDDLLRFIATILAYAALELASFIGLHFAIVGMFGISPLYQVAFVLESQVVLVQAKLIVWLLFALEFNVEHYGASVSSLWGFHKAEFANNFSLYMSFVNQRCRL